MSIISKKARPQAHGNTHVAVLCLCILLLTPLGINANESNGWSLVPEKNIAVKAVSSRPSYTINPTPIKPLRIQPVEAAAPLALHGNNVRPLFFELHNEQFNQSTNLLSQGQLNLTSILGWQPMEKMVVALGLQTSIFDQPASSTHFQAISSIQCESASMEPGLYRANNCHFINNSETLTQSINNFSSLGASWAPNDMASLQLEYFRQNTSTANLNSQFNAALPSLLTSGHNPLTDNRAFLPSALLGGNAKLDGFGLDLALGFEHDKMGKLRLGLQLSQITHAEFSTSTGVYNQSPIPLAQISPFRTATVNIDWKRGSFSGGVQGFYREPLSTYNQVATDQFSGFDIYFSWQAPWNANFSIGTSTLIEPGITNNATEKGNNNDPFEMIYGRVPYVRYQQSL